MLRYILLALFSLVNNSSYALAKPTIEVVGIVGSVLTIHDDRDNDIKSIVLDREDSGLCIKSVAPLSNALFRLTLCDLSVLLVERWNEKQSQNTNPSQKSVESTEGNLDYYIVDEGNISPIENLVLEQNPTVSRSDLHYFLHGLDMNNINPDRLLATEVASMLRACDKLDIPPSNFKCVFYSVATYRR